MPAATAAPGGLFHQRFVTTGAFDQHLHSLAQRAQKAREGADYEAITPDPAEAKGYVDDAASHLVYVPEGHPRSTPRRSTPEREPEPTKPAEPDAASAELG